MENLSPKRHAQRLKLYAAGLIDPRIAEAQGVTRWAIYDWRRRRGLPPNDSPKIKFAFANAAKQKLALERLRLIEAGWTDASIALHQQRNSGSIFNFRKSRNLAAGPGTLDEKPMLVSFEVSFAETRLADPFWSNWLEEMGATVW